MPLTRYQRMRWAFPAGRLHHGIPVGSGNFGGIIWGDGMPLSISFNTAEKNNAMRHKYIFPTIYSTFKEAR